MAILPKIVYNFNENSDSTIRDYSENTNDGVGSNLTISSSSRVGYDANFNASNSEIDLGVLNDLNGVDSCAIHLGMKINSSTGTKKIITRNWQFNLIYNYTTNEITFELEVDSGTASVSSGTLAVDTFYDFDFIYSGDVLTLYQDGSIVDSDSSQSGVVDNSDASVIIGNTDAGTPNSALFLLNEFKLYDTSITTDMVSAFIDEQNGILCDDTINSVFALGDVLYSNINTSPVYAVVSWIGTGTDFRFLPLTSGILNGDIFKRGANLWDTDRQWGLKIDDTPQVCFYDGQSNSSEIFAESKKTVCITKEGVLKGSSTKTANYTILSSDQRIYVDSTSGSFTITLEASPTTNKEIEIIDSVGGCSVYNVTIDGNGNNIVGETSAIMNINYTAFVLVYNGTQWNLK